MAKTVSSSSDQLQIQNKLDTSLALQPMDNIPEERIDSSENQKFGRGNDNKISHQIKAEALAAFQTPRQVLEQIDINPVNTTPVARNLQHIESQEGAFENGYVIVMEIREHIGVPHTLKENRTQMNQSFRL